MDAGARAAAVAEELLAFYREPALRRPRYLHGESALPDGAVVFRLALGRPVEGFEALSAAEREAAGVAAAAFVRQVCLWERATNYQVLCLEPDATAEQVRENYHLLIALIHPDRHDATWPAGGAQRANHAYAVLSDAAQRAQYDTQLLKASGRPSLDKARASPAPEATAPRGPRRDTPGRVLARFAVVAGVVAALFIVQAWWVGDVSPQHSLLERAIPASGRWVREALPDAPRFLGAAVEPGERLAPIEEPRRLAALASWVPFVEPRAPAPPPAPPSATPVEIAPVVESPAQSAPAPARAEARPPAAPIAAAQAAPPPVRIAQAAAPAGPAAASPGVAGLTREQVEGLVALLVGYYGAGDADRLVALFDEDRLGFWGEIRTRGAYSDFFDATRARRVRIERLAWQANGAVAQARGDAIVTAEYRDGRPRLERRVPVELDIVLRGAEPRLARLVLFPHAP